MSANSPAVPPRGWNSWDSYGTAVTEAEVLANARFMAEHLLPYGWDTVVVDIQWYEPNARAGGYNDNAEVVLDDYGRPFPATNRFPSAADGRGFSALAETVHRLGLKFGLHIMRGIPKRAVERRLPVLATSASAADIADESAPCTWNTDNFGLDHSRPEAAAYYASLARLFADWGVDFVKADDMLWPYRRNDIEALSDALAGSGRDIALSLSPGVDVSTVHASHLRRHAAMWRVSNDLWDNWADLFDQFQRMARWAPYSGAGGFADADMLPLGHIGIRAERGQDRMSLLTAAEQQTMMTLWAVSRSPLFVGGDLPTSTPETIALLTNAVVLDVNARGQNSREVLRETGYAVWTAELDGHAVVAVFAIDDQPLELVLPLSSVGLTAGVAGSEAWSGAPAIVHDGALAVDLPVHGSALFLLC